MNLPPWSYTSLDSYRVCPHQFWHRFILKDIVFEKSDALVKGIETHEALEHRVADKTPLPEDLQRHETFAKVFDAKPARAELKLGITSDGHACDFFARNVYGRGKIDVVVVEDKTAAIYDWKTGKVRENPFELAVQAVLLKAKYPRLEKIIGAYIWLETHQLGNVYDLSTTAPYWDEINQRVKEIEEQAQAGVWPKRPSPLCGWCGVKSCEHNPHYAPTQFPNEIGKLQAGRESPVDGRR